MKEFKLCYVENNILFFTDNFETQWGDDWGDEPYSCNAGTPYELKDDEPLKEGYGHIKLIAFDGKLEIKQPCDYSDYFSVEDINQKAIAWLFHYEAGALLAGTTMKDAKKWLNTAKIKWGELILHEDVG